MEATVVTETVALMYAESRLPGVSRGDFVERWRQHGAFALSVPRFRSAVCRYVHRDPLLDLSRFPGANAGYDALGEIVCPDMRTLTELLASTELREEIRADGALTFARARTAEVIVEERYLRDDRMAPVSVSAFLSVRTSTRAALHRVTEVQHALSASSGPLAALARRIGVSPSVRSRTAWDIYLDLAFDDVDDAAVTYAAWLPAFRAAVGNILADELVLVSIRRPLLESMACTPEQDRPRNDS